MVPMKIKHRRGKKESVVEMKARHRDGKAKKDTKKIYLCAHMRLSSLDSPCGNICTVSV